LPASATISTRHFPGQLLLERVGHLLGDAIGQRFRRRISAHFFAGPDLLNNRDAEYPVAPFNTSTGAQISNRNLFVEVTLLTNSLRSKRLC